MSLSEKVKNQSTVSILVISLFLGLVAAGMSVLYLKNREEALRLKYAKKPEPMATIVVPIRDLFPGETLSPRTVATMQIPAKYADKNIVNGANYKKVQGRRLQFAVSRGKQIPLSSLVGINTQDFSDNITVGKRGVTIKVDIVNSFDGMLRPGNKVDLLLGMDAETAGVQLPAKADGTAASGEEVIFPLLENILVLATGTDSVSNNKQIFGGTLTDADFSTITVDLYPEQVAMLKSAEDTGRIIAALRNRNDKGSSGYDSVRPSQLMDLMQKARNAALARASTQVVTDANGNVIGRVVGDTVYDAQGNVIGKVNENGEVVDAEGNVIGQSQQGQVALGADGKPIGTIVGDKVYDENGNLIGRVNKDGQVVSLDGEVIGNASTGVAVDANGNVLGNVVNGVVYDENGNVVGRVDENGNVVAADGTILGSTVNKVAIGHDGKPIGTIVGDTVYDENGNVIGKVDKDGNVVGLDGKVIGSVADNVKVADVALDANGNVIGRIDENGNVIDEHGNIIGKVDANGNIVDAEGNVIGTKAEGVLLDANGNVVSNDLLDADGNVIGKVIGNQVFDENGNLIGTVDESGQVIGLDGKPMDATVAVGKVDSQLNNPSAAGNGVAGASGFETQAVQQVYDSMVGGNAENGVLKVQTTPVE